MYAPPWERPPLDHAQDHLAFVRLLIERRLAMSGLRGVRCDVCEICCQVVVQALGEEMQSRASRFERWHRISHREGEGDGAWTLVGLGWG